MTMPAQFPALQQRGLAKFIKLALDFSANETLDPRITFSRTSNATRVNAQGLIEYAPHNLLTYSENFDNAVWGTQGLVPAITANSITAPDGTLTADKIVFGAGDSRLLKANISFSAGVTYVVSLYVKPVSTAQNNTIRLAIYDGVNQLNSNDFVLTTSNWQRITFTVTPLSTSASGTVQIRNALNSSVQNEIYIWGAQLNVGSLQPYYTTSVKNLLGYSQNFENAAWTKSNSSIDATPVMGPLGFLGAEKLVESAVAGQHYILQNISIGVNGKYTASIYAKKAEKTNLTIWLLNAATADRAAVNVNLIDGTYVSAEAGGAPFIDISVNVVNVGDGWFRCGISATTTGGAISLQARYFGNAGSSYTGDGTSGIYIFGAQLSDSASLDPYSYNFDAAPTSSAYYGPRFDYDPVTLAPKGLLIEEQRTNLLTYSEQFDNASWAKSNATVTANAIAAPDGTLTADKLIKDNAATTDQNIYRLLSVTATIYVASIYVKRGEWSGFQIFARTISDITAYSLIDLNTGVVTINNHNIIVTPANDGYWRICSLHLTTSGSLNIYYSPTINGSTYGINSIGNGTSGIYIWGAQLEVGAFPTSYIPTTSTQVTRAADNASMVGTNFSSWYNQSEGTLVCSSDSPQTTTIATMNWYLTNNAVDNTMFNRKNLANTISTGVVVNNVAQGDIVSGTTISANVTAQSAFSYKLNDLAISVNGAAVGTDSLANIPFVEKLYLGTNAGAGQVLNGHIKSFKFFSKRLLNTYLQSLTQ